MGTLRRLGEGLDFPPTSSALEYPNGLLAVGGDLSVARLLAAYRRGIFPWYEEPQPVLWWSPDPRMVLFPEELHISRSLRKALRTRTFSLAVDTCFETVVRACAQTRADGLGTWIDTDMIEAYRALHDQGYAHSIEVFLESELVGGLYGVSLGRAFFGESMFSRCSNASKIALVALVNIARGARIELIDCQVQSDHLLSLGARNIPRLDFEARLAQTVGDQLPAESWHLPPTSEGLL